MGRRRRNKKSKTAKTKNIATAGRTKRSASSTKGDGNSCYDQTVPSSRGSASTDEDCGNQDSGIRICYSFHAGIRSSIYAMGIRSPICTRSRQRLLNERSSGVSLGSNVGSSTESTTRRGPVLFMHTSDQVRRDDAYKKAAMKKKQVKKTPKPIRAPKKKPNRRSKRRIVHDDNVYIIDKVLRTRKRRGVNEYLVKWQGYDNSHNSWVLDRDILGTPPVITDTDSSNATEIVNAGEIYVAEADVSFDNENDASIMDEDDANARVNPVASTSLSSNRILSNEPLTPTIVSKTKSTTISLRKGPESLPSKRVDNGQRIVMPGPGGSCCLNGVIIPPKNSSRSTNIVTAYLQQKNSTSKSEPTATVAHSIQMNGNEGTERAANCKASTSTAARFKEPALWMSPPAPGPLQDPLNDCHVRLNDLQSNASTTIPSPVALVDQSTSPAVLPITIPQPPESSSSFISTSQGYNPYLIPECIRDIAIYQGRRFLQIKWVGVFKRRWILDSVVKRHHPDLVFEFYERERDRLLGLLNRVGQPQTRVNTTPANTFPQSILPN